MKGKDYLLKWLEDRIKEETKKKQDITGKSSREITNIVQYGGKIRGFKETIAYIKKNVDFERK